MKYLFHLLQTLLGNRYGYQSFPSKIKTEEFKLLQEISEKEDNKDRHLLSEWFRQDDNSIDSEYLLQVNVIFILDILNLK